MVSCDVQAGNGKIVVTRVSSEMWRTGEAATGGRVNSPAFRGALGNRPPWVPGERGDPRQEPTALPPHSAGSRRRI